MTADDDRIARLIATNDIDTPGCDCGHDGMGSTWHASNCVWLDHEADAPDVFVSTDYAVELFVPGKPAPQGSKKHMGNGVMVESSKAVGPWRAVVSWHAAQAYRSAPLDGAVWASLLFIMPRPASTPKRATPHAIKRPDLDKLTRAIFDSLSGVVWRDDSQVVQVVASKRLAQLDEQPGVHIRVRHA